MKTVLTELGKNKILASIQNQQPLTFAEIAIGDGNGVSVNPDPAESELRNEVFRAPITSLTPVAGGQLVHASLLIPANVGGFVIREARLDLQDGTMLAYASTPEIEKPVGAGVVRLNIVVELKTETGVPAVIAISGGNATQDWVSQHFAPAGAPQKIIEGAAYTATLADANHVLITTAAEPVRIDVPASLPPEWACNILQGGTGSVRIDAGETPPLSEDGNNTLEKQGRAAAVVRLAPGAAHDFWLSGALTDYLTDLLLETGEPLELESGGTLELEKQLETAP